MTYTIGEVSLGISVSQSSLRKWEEQGVVSPVRDAKGWRVYNNEDIKTLRQFIVDRYIQPNQATQEYLALVKKLEVLI